MIGWSVILSGTGVAAGVLVFLRVVANHLAVLEQRLADQAASMSAARANPSPRSPNGGKSTAQG